MLRWKIDAFFYCRLRQRFERPLMSAPRSEQAFLDIIDRFFPENSPAIRIGRGDDCALFSCPSSLCITTDLFVEDVHFRRSYFSPEQIGHKALAVNISDMAAMGAKPLGFSLGLVAPRDVSTAFWESFFRGMAALARRFDLPLTGGDLSMGDKITASITLWGTPEHRALRRRQARVGDALFVIGPVGLARAGLLLLEKGDASGAFPACLTAHLSPTPLVEQGQLLATIPGVRGLMDVSDGLAQDLPRFLGPGLGADIILDGGVIHPEVRQYCAQAGLNPELFCFMGGEDYALLGAADEESLIHTCKLLPDTWRLGRVTAAGLCLNGKYIQVQGFDHFAQD
jgi:thiamine-monophosphate kinase